MRQALIQARAQVVARLPWLAAFVAAAPGGLVERGRRLGLDAAGRLQGSEDSLVGRTPEELQWLIAHLALHRQLRHFEGRRRDALWDAACDLEVIARLRALGLPEPRELAGCAAPRGWSAERLADALRAGTLSPPPALDAHESTVEALEAASPEDAVPGGGEGAREEQGTASTQDETEDISLRAFEPGDSGTPGPAGQGGLLATGHRLLPVAGVPVAGVAWRAVLDPWLSRVLFGERRYDRPSRRRESSEFLWPGEGGRTAELAVALDVSGSIDAERLAHFINELAALRAMLPLDIYVLAADTHVRWAREVAPHEALHLPDAAGGGGTDFRPVFEWLEARGRPPDALLYFTDGEGRYPSQAPSWPVLWIVPPGIEPPWGEKVVADV